MESFNFSLFQNYSKNYSLEEIEQVDRSFLEFIENISNGVLSVVREKYNRKPFNRKNKSIAGWYFAFRLSNQSESESSIGFDSTIRGTDASDEKTPVYNLHLVIPGKNIDIPIVERVSNSTVKTSDGSLHEVSIDNFDALSFFDTSNVEIATKNILQEFVSSLKDGQGLLEDWIPVLSSINKKHSKMNSKLDSKSLEKLSSSYLNEDSKNETNENNQHKSDSNEIFDLNYDSDSSRKDKNNEKNFLNKSQNQRNISSHLTKKTKEKNTKKKILDDHIQYSDDDMDNESDDRSEGMIDENDDMSISKRMESYNRGWTDEEISHLVQGVIRFGFGKWKKILNCKDYNFKSCRNTNSISHKARYMGLQKYKHRSKGKSEKLVKKPKEQKEQKEKKSTKENIEKVTERNQTSSKSHNNSFNSNNTQDNEISLLNTNKLGDHDDLIQDDENLLNGKSRKRTVTQREAISKKDLESDFMRYVSDSDSSVDVSKNIKRKRVEDIPPERLRVLPPPSELNDGLKSSSERLSPNSSNRVDSNIWNGIDKKSNKTISKDENESIKKPDSLHIPSWSQQDIEQSFLHANPKEIPTSLKDNSDEDDLDEMDKFL